MVIVSAIKMELHLKMRRIHHRKCLLCLGGHGIANGPHLAITPGLLCNPFHRIVAILSFVLVVPLSPDPLGPISSPHALKHEYISSRGEKACSFDQDIPPSAIVRPLQNDRKPALSRNTLDGGSIYIRR